MEKIIKFVENSSGFDNSNKLRLLLLLAGVKPSAYVQLRITNNLHDKHDFEELLKEKGIIFEASKAKGFEEIVKVDSAAHWKLKGTWYGYDLFSTKPYAERFLEYVQLLKSKKHELADMMAGIIYGYPKCCIEKFVKQHQKINKSYYQHFKELNDMDKAFPFICHTPCSLKCKATKKLNNLYKNTVKKVSPKFFKEYSKKSTHRVPVVVDIENDIPGMWKKKDGHDYIYVTKAPINGKYLIISWLTKAVFKRGDVLDADVTVQYDFASLKIRKSIGHIKNFHHERHFTKL